MITRDGAPPILIGGTLGSADPRTRRERHAAQTGAPARETGGRICSAAQTVRLGDWTMGDGGGVMIIPREQTVEPADHAADVLERKDRLHGEIEAGRGPPRAAVNRSGESAPSGRHRAPPNEAVLRCAGPW